MTAACVKAMTRRKAACPWSSAPQAPARRLHRGLPRLTASLSSASTTFCARQPASFGRLHQIEQMPVGPAAGLARLPFPAKQADGDFQERPGRKFRKTADRLEQDGPQWFACRLCVHSFARPEASSPFAMSILVALYLSGAAFARATDIACSLNSALSVLPLRKVFHCRFAQAACRRCHQRRRARRQWSCREAED